MRSFLVSVVVALGATMMAWAAPAHAQLVEITSRGNILINIPPELSRDIYLADTVTARVLVDTSKAATEEQIALGQVSKVYPGETLEFSLGQWVYSAASGTIGLTILDVDASASDWFLTNPADTYAAVSNEMVGPQIPSTTQPPFVFSITSVSVAGRGALNAISDTSLDVDKFTTLKNIRLTMLVLLTDLTTGAIMGGGQIHAFAVAATVCQIDVRDHGQPRRRCKDLQL